MMVRTRSLVVPLLIIGLTSSHSYGLPQEVLQLYSRKPLEDISLDDLHGAALQDQRANYIEPIKSLRTRQLTSLNGLYDFCFDPDAGELGLNWTWPSSSLVDSCKRDNFHRMPVPSAFNEILSHEEAKNYMGWMWYQTEITLSAGRDEFNSSLLLQFENINYLGLVWVQPLNEAADATLYGVHIGGHLPLVVDLSELLRLSIDANQQLNLRLTIAVSNQLNEHTVPSGRMHDLSAVVGRKLAKFEPDFDFFHFAGIMGDVQLVRVSRLHIKRVYLSELHRRHLKMEMCVANLGERELELMREERLLFTFQADRAVNNELDFEMSQQFNEGGCTSIRVKCANATARAACKLMQELNERKWPEATRWRSLRVRIVALEASGLWRVRDTFETKLIGRANMRKVMEQSGGQLQGFGMHQEQLFSGRSMSLASIMKDLQLLKQVGANVLRTSHYPYSRAYLEACDELGIMVIAECPAVGLRQFHPLTLELHKESLREMMLRDHEHASIVMWSVANEPASEKAEARAYFEQVLQFARTELAEFTVRAGRPLTGAIAQSHEADRIGHLLDVIMINRYFGWYDFTGTLETIEPALRESLLGWAKRYGKPLLVSEFGADTLAGLHSGELFSEQFQRDLIEEHERLFDQLAAGANKTQLDFLGALIWNFADFSTHESLLRVGGNKKGVFTADRKPKMAAESVKRIFRSRAGLDVRAARFAGSRNEL